MKTKYTVAITKRALVQRINRKLRHEDQILKALRGERDLRELGEYFIVNFNHNRIVYTHCDLQKLGRELQALKPWERIEREES